MLCFQVRQFYQIRPVVAYDVPQKYVSFRCFDTDGLEYFKQTSNNFVTRMSNNNIIIPCKARNADQI